MACVSLEKFIIAESQLAHVHFLLKTKAQRGDRSAFIYNAERFFDLHETNNLSDLITTRTDHLENAMSRGLIRLGALILMGGFAALAKPPLSLCTLPFALYLIWEEIGLIRHAYLLDRSLKEYVRTLRETMPTRKNEFVREMIEKTDAVASCIRT
ncbi:hypothetical protein [Geobacter sp.]|uniref:hypothetical protein n=1 Tax=Geobacter sp. TaxID=46610 RepID=UPI001AC32D69|nr:hypothetical protein [Geobacter sp.]CAG0951462.1 hypothetical protein GEOBC_00217 [Geobacteraceae bacterium]